MNEEYLFLLACARFKLDPQQFPVPIYPLNSSIQELVSQVLHHRIAGLLYQIGKSRPGIWPEDLQKRLKANHYANFISSERYIYPTKTALSALRDANIPVIALKTWAFFSTIYAGDYTSRSFADVDLLVQPQDVKKAEAVLFKQDFQLANELWPGNRFRYYNAEFSYYKPGEGGQTCAIDLHWGFFSFPYYDERIQIADIFFRAAPLEVAGVPVLRLGTEDEILFACGHLSLHHQYAQNLHRYYELAWVIRKADPAVDWAVVFNHAASWRLTCALKRILLETEALFPHTLPDEIVQELQALPSDKNEEKIHAWFVKYSPTQLSMIRPSRWTLSSICYAIGLLAETAFPSPRYLENKYGPTKFLPMNYFRRLADITGRLPKK